MPFQQLNYESIDRIMSLSNRFQNESNHPVPPPQHHHQQQQQQQPKTKFSSNLAAVLNDPSKDRNKVPYLFTKTWGNDFTENATIGSINTIHSNYKNYKPNEFQPYLNSTHDVAFSHLIKLQIDLLIYNLGFFF